MRQTIYVDILMGVNLIIDYFMLMLEAKVFNLDVKRKRLIYSAMIGSLYSLFIFVDNLNGILSILIKILMSITLVLIAFGKKSWYSFLKLIIVFYLFNFLFGGLTFFIWYFYSPKGLYIKNGMIYFNISPIFLIISTGIIYLILKIYYNLIGNDNKYLGICKIKVKNDGKEVILRAKIDTGNDLKEPFSNIPVIVSELKSIEPALSEELRSCFVNFYERSKDINFSYKEDGKKLRIIPFNTISNSGVLLGFIPDEVTIKYKKNAYNVKSYLAVSNKKVADGDFEALVNPELIL